MLEFHDSEQLTKIPFNFVELLRFDLNSGRSNYLSLPDWFVKTKRAIRDRSSSPAGVARAVSLNHALTAAIMRRANSAHYSGSVYPVDNTASAIERVGFDVVFNFATLMVLDQFFREAAHDRIKRYLNVERKHCLQVAVLAHILARRVPTLNADAAFLAGMLYRVGKLYVLVRSQEISSLLESEQSIQDIMQMQYTEIGRAIVRHWGFSEELASVIVDHADTAVEGATVPCIRVVVAIASGAPRLWNSNGPDTNPGSLPNCPVLGLNEMSAVNVILDAREELVHLYHSLGW